MRFEEERIENVIFSAAVKRKKKAIEKASFFHLHILLLLSTFFSTHYINHLHSWGHFIFLHERWLAWRKTIAPVVPCLRFLTQTLTPTHFFFDVPAQIARGRFVVIVNDMQNHTNKHTSGGRDSCAAISYVEMETLRLASFFLRLPLGPFVYCAKLFYSIMLTIKEKWLAFASSAVPQPLCDGGRVALQAAPVVANHAASLRRLVHFV